jgi:hypothetical protein
MLARMLRLLALLLLAVPASANEVPPCDARRAGAVACLSGRACECRYERGGSITGQSTSYRWNCGILRPSCGEAPQPVPLPLPLPDLLLQLPPPHTPWPR